MEKYLTKQYYTHASTRYGKVLYRGYEVTDSGARKRISGKVPYKPSLYLETTDQDSPFKSIYGVPLRKREFESISAAKEYIKSYETVTPIYGYAGNRFEYNFIADAFPDVLEVGLDELVLATVDIETTTEHGKIDPYNVPEEITLISYYDQTHKKVTTFGSKFSNRENYILCKDEDTMLREFIKLVVREDPDILTGWNLAGFDIPYIINRIELKLGEGASNALSPFGVIDVRDENVKGKLFKKYTIVGRSILDMQDLYKKFTFEKRENYKLQTIAMVELGVGKMDNPFDTFKEFYTGECDIFDKPLDSDHYLRKLAYRRTHIRNSTDPRDIEEFLALDKQIKQESWDEFVHYNQIDVIRVSELEDVLGLISLALTLAYLTKCNFNDVFSPVKYWECYIMSTLSYQNIFCGITRKHSNTESLDGAYVMEPTPGFYDWVISIDGKSLYPYIIRGLNFSPETILGMDPDCDIESLLSGKHNFLNEDFCVAANGAMFKRGIEGVMPKLVAGVLGGRESAKKAMLKAKQAYQVSYDPADKKYSLLQDTFQKAFKVAANSLFGICGNEGFLFFDHRIAEAITHTGQFILRYIGEYTNNKFNEFFKTDGQKYLIYGDTDSLYFTFGNIVEKYYKGKTDLQITQALDKLMESHLRKFINEATENISKMLNYRLDDALVFKREAIGSGGFWLAKKKYALKVYNNEGVQYDNGDFKILGLEVVRSSTPQIARDYLRECVVHVINKDIDKLREVVDIVHKKFLTESIESISFPRGANNLLEYSDENTIYRPRTPIAVRAALLHNHYIDKLGLTLKYQPIDEGERIKFVYLKEPNHFKENVIGYTDKLPKEFHLEEYIDRELQFEKVFMSPLNGIMTAVGWSIEEKSTLDDFFS